MDATNRHEHYCREAESWYAVHVRSNFERRVAAGLRAGGVETFLPTYKVRRQWSDRVKQTEVPLFPGYVFCRFDANNRKPIVTMPGVVQILGNGKTPVPVSEAELAAVRTVVLSSAAYEPWNRLEPGMPVVVESGALKGVQGVLVEVRSEWRLVISISLLQRSVAVEVDACFVRPRGAAASASDHFTRSESNCQTCSSG